MYRSQSVCFGSLTLIPEHLLGVYWPLFSLRIRFSLTFKKKLCFSSYFICFLAQHYCTLTVFSLYFLNWLASRPNVCRQCFKKRMYTDRHTHQHHFRYTSVVLMYTFVYISTFEVYLSKYHWIYLCLTRFYTFRINQYKINTKSVKTYRSVFKSVFVYQRIRNV